MRFYPVLLFLAAASALPFSPATEFVPTEAELVDVDFPDIPEPATTPNLSTDLFRRGSGNPLVCRSTQHYSLWVTDIHEAANKMIRQYSDKQLCSHIWKGNPCTQWGSQNEVRLQVCSNTYGANVRCHSVAWAAKHIANNCRDGADPRKAAGWYFFEKANVRVKVGNY